MLQHKPTLFQQQLVFKYINRQVINIAKCVGWPGKNKVELFGTLPDKCKNVHFKELHVIETKGCFVFGKMWRI